MLNTNSQPHSRRYLSLLYGIACVLISMFLFPGLVLARSTNPPSFASAENFSINVGFDARYRDNSWVPIHISLKNNGADFSGTVSINVQADTNLNNFAPPSTYQEAVSLPSGSRKDLTLYIPLFIGMPGNTSTITASLLDSNGHTISSRVSRPQSLNTDDILIGTLSDQDLPLTTLNSLPLSDPTASIYNYHLRASTFPDVADVLNNFDAILLDNFTTSALSSVQLTALQNWVARGGNLIVVGGPEWRRTLSPLPAKLLPVTLEGSDLLPAHSSLLPLGGPTKDGPQAKKSEDSLSSVLPVSTGIANAEAITVLTSNTAPLIVESAVGQGQVCYLAFDPTLSPLVNWSNISTLWKGVLFRVLGDKMLMTNINSGITSTWRMPASTYDSMSSLLQALFPSSILSPLILFVLLLSYILLLGPVRLVLVRMLKNRDWSWRIIICTIVIFSSLSYALTIRQKGSSIISSSVSVIQLGQGDANKTSGEVTTYLDIFVPNQGSFQVHMPGSSLVQPDTDPNSQTHSPTVIRSGQGGIDVNLTGLDSWTSHALISQHDLQISGSLLSQLLLQNNILQGSVTNTLPYALNDAYVLYNNHPIALGHLGSHQTQQVNFPLSDASSSSQNISIADQIAALKNVQTPYNQPTSPHPPQNDLQQRIMTLQALSGENCGNSACNQLTTNRQYYALKHFSNAASLLTAPDPLLLPGAAATLIGWIDPNPEMMGNVTINGNPSTGKQEALLQAPLDISYRGPIPAGTMTTAGQLITIQQPKDATIQTLMSDIYVMSAGSLTFEFMLPNIPNLYANRISILEPQNLANALTSAGGGLALAQDDAYMHGYLYNWQTQSWDSFMLNQYHYTPVNTQAYIGPGGRVLAQLTNDNPSVGEILVGTPSLDIQGIVTN